ncbi:arylsulfatase B-like [Bacillus rossius redtenbacheri]|uniref:arylsulfatase B-like n=1 Tax=Bacillus rossius redtenbacheri TaxID=93214 RepID=UPI002FDD8C83
MAPPGSLLACCLLALTSRPLVARTTSGRPHIVFIVADDLGWNDVSFHGADQIPTPNMDALAFNGVILNSHYAQPSCTPSRAALMTGRYPIRLGMQGLPLLAAEPRGLPEGQILPGYLQELGYSTHAVGKWHLGFYKKSLTPTQRGFHSHFGYWAGFVSYYDYILQDTYPDGPYSGFDLRRNYSLAWDRVGRYATDVFTEEAEAVIGAHDPSTPLFLYLAHLAVHAGNRGKFLEAPQEAVDAFRHIADPNRRTYAAMVSKLDESVGRVVAALQSRRMLEDSIIVLLSDNGAPTIGTYPTWGSNFPLRGLKETLWEGGVRVPALVWSPLLYQTPRVSSQLMHISDWLPTLLAAAGGPPPPADIDGVNQWDALVYNLPSRRNSVLVNIDERERTAAFRFGNYKMVVGSARNGEYDGYFGASGRDSASPPYNASAVVQSSAGQAIDELFKTLYRAAASPSEISFLRSAASLQCRPSGAGVPCRPAQTRESCLYDVELDPCETNNLAPEQPATVRALRHFMIQHRKHLVPQANLPPDSSAADPAKFGNVWTSWGDAEPV